MPTALQRLTQDGTLVILAAAILSYVVARTALDVLAGGRGITAGRLAFSHAIPMAAVAWVAAWNRQGDLALAVILGSAVAAMMLVLGLSLTGDALDDADLPPSVRAWQFLLPTALLIMLTGFGSRLTLTHAAMLAAMGVLVAGVWREGQRPDVSSTATPASADGTRWLRGVLAPLLAVVAGWLALKGGLAIATSRPGLSPGVVGVTVLSAMLALPATGFSTLMARTARVGMAIATQVATVMILLTLVLPVTIAIWYARAIVGATSAVAATQPTSEPMDLLQSIKGFPFSIGLWRIETVMLVALALPMIPIGMGRWRPGRVEGVVLIVGYVLYLGLVTAMGSRWH